MKAALLHLALESDISHSKLAKCTGCATGSIGDLEIKKETWKS